MPAGCVQCWNGEWQCGPDTSELCDSGGIEAQMMRASTNDLGTEAKMMRASTMSAVQADGWTPAGSIQLKFFVRKHPKSGNCVLKVVPVLMTEFAPVLPQPLDLAPIPASAPRKKLPRKK